MNDLFPKPETPWRPLADRMRPARLGDFYGQTHLLAPDKPLRQAIESNVLHSMIFWGPPGTGKTTLARLIAAATAAHFIAISAVFAGVKEIRAAVEEAKQARAGGKPTVLFVDEVHRFNKAQQDGFLPYVEDGTLTFIGATTENPSFELNNALLSRARVYVLKALTSDDIRRVLEHARVRRPSINATGHPSPSRVLGHGALLCFAGRGRPAVEPRALPARAKRSPTTA